MNPPDMIERKPDYIDNPLLGKLFCRTLDLLKKKPDSQRKKRLIISQRKYFTELFEKDDPYDNHASWDLIEKCKNDGLLFFEKYNVKNDPNPPPWAKFRVIFNTAYEQKLRNWLDYHLFTKDEKEWQDAINQYSPLFACPEKLVNPITGIRTLDKTAHEVIRRLASIPDVLAEKPMTAYQLSAHLFWGNSKVFINNEQWLKELLGLPDGLLVERPILIEVSFPLSLPEGVIMIENLDTYVLTCDRKLEGCENLITVYTQGFRGASSRIRNAIYSRFHFYEPEHIHLKQSEQFRSSWMNISSFPYPVYFFGDLDWAGMEIFCSLKTVFPELLPWKKGYKKLIAARDAGKCHTPSMASKKRQKIIESTGDDWLDENVLKPMTENPLFVDQEVFC